MVIPRASRAADQMPGCSSDFTTYELRCPCCRLETIVIDLGADAEYECAVCGYAFYIEVETRPFSTRLFDLTPIIVVH